MARNVFTIIDELATDLAELRRMLGPLASLGGERSGPSRTGSRGGARRKPRSGAKAATWRRRPVTAAVRAGRRLQGQYLAAVRPLTKAQRVQVKRILAKDGKQAAIKAAKGMQKAG